MQTIPAALQAARVEWVRAEHLPQLPAWWPLDPTPNDDEPNPTPYSDDERAARRHAAALTEARRGPDDGTRGEVIVFAAGPPKLLRVHNGSWAYRLDESESDSDHAVYRYSPDDSPAHASTMRVVEQAYVETGPAYIVQARTDEAQHDGITAERIA